MTESVTIDIITIYVGLIEKEFRKIFNKKISFTKNQINLT